MEKFTCTVLRGGDGGNAIPLTRPWRKGQRYGSIIVDLQSHTILDLLPERTVGSVSAWLEAHPDVEVVSRDPGRHLCRGCHGKRAPLAVQVCDRWHLLKNLGDAARAFLMRKRVLIPADPLQEASEEEEPPKPAETTSPQLSRRAELSQQRLRKRQEICQQAKDLHEKGWSIHAIAKHLDRERTTIRTYLKAEGTWQSAPRQPGRSLLDPYRESILILWEPGCHKGQHILRTIQAQGYEGSDTLLRAFVTQLRKQLPIKAVADSQASLAFRSSAKTPREIRWLLTKHREDLTDVERTELDRLLQASREVKTLRLLLHRFLNIIRQRKHEQLRPWMEAAIQSGIAELKSFVAGIERDYDAVKAALRLSWRKANYGGQSEQTKDDQTRYVWQGQLHTLTPTTFI